MDFNYRATNHAHAPPLMFTPPPPPPPPINLSYLPHQHFPGHGGWYNGYYHLEGPNSAIEMSEFMRREMEKGKIREEIMMENVWRHIQKERIREEIIADEIMTRRLLEAEVRRELGLQRGGDLFIGPTGFPGPLVPFDMEGRPLGERFVRPEFGGFGIGLQMSPDPRSFEAKPPFGNGKQKEKIVLPAKPIQDVNMSVPSSAGSAKKPLKEEWSCALCQVTASSEQGLNEHLHGKRHKSKAAGLRKKENKCNIGWGTKDAPSASSKVSNKSEQNIVKSAESALPSQDPIKNSPGNKNMCKIWCETCQVGVGTLKEMEEHRTGRKHFAKLQKSNQNTKLVHVIDELIITKTDCDDGENSASEDSSAVFLKVDLDEQVKEEANVGAETSSENPEKSSCPMVIISQRLDDSMHDIDLEAQHQHLDDSVGHNDLEAQWVEEANVGAETSSEIPEKSGDSMVIDDSGQHSGSPIERKQENKNLLRFWCEMCQIGTYSEKLMEDHRTGRKHLANLGKNKVIRAGQQLTVTKNDGNHSENSESEDSSVVAHENAGTSSDTRKRTGDPLISLSKRLDDSVRNTGTPIVRTHEHKKNLSRFWCEICQIGTTTEKDMEIHRTGKKHLAHKKKLFRFWCDACQIGIDSEKDLEMHRTGKKHLSRLQNCAMQPVQDAEANSLGTKTSCNLLKNKSQLSDVGIKKKEEPIWKMKEIHRINK